MLHFVELMIHREEIYQRIQSGEPIDNGGESDDNIGNS